MSSRTNGKRVYKLDLFPNSSHMRIFNLIQSNSKVLDIGCATGYLGEKLIKEKNCEVTGVEPNKDWASEAANTYRKVYIGNIESIYDRINELEGYFDYIIFGDVLEHTSNPEKVLTELNALASDNGKILISLPNIANVFIRLNLLLGRFEYVEKGILDRTHLRFYTKKTGKKMIESTGIKVTKVIPIGKIIHYVRIMPTLFAYQFLFVCRKQS